MLNFRFEWKKKTMKKCFLIQLFSVELKQNYSCNNFMLAFQVKVFGAHTFPFLLSGHNFWLLPFRCVVAGFIWWVRFFFVLLQKAKGIGIWFNLLSWKSQQIQPYTKSGKPINKIRKIKLNVIPFKLAKHFSYFVRLLNIVELAVSLSSFTNCGTMEYMVLYYFSFTDLRE